MELVRWGPYPLKEIEINAWQIEKVSNRQENGPTCIE